MNQDIIKSFLFESSEGKDEAWITEKVWVVMQNAKHIISKADYDFNKNVLSGEFPDARLDDIFASAPMKKIKKRIPQSTVYFFEKILNALIDDRTSAGLSITVNSLDPSKDDKRKSDKELLANRKGIEALINGVTANNGMPPVKFTEKDYHGNVAMFDQMAYDEFDPVDVNNFFDNHYGLLQEIYLQPPVDHVFASNQILRKYDKYIKDIAICLHTCSQVWVDETSGAIKIDYLFPWQVKVLNATGSNDYKDSQGFNIPRSTNVRGFLKKMGNKFKFEENWQLLISSATGGDPSEYTGLISKGELIYGTTGKLMDFKALMDLPIKYSYTEFKTTTEKVKSYGVTKEGNIIPMTVDKNTPATDGAPTEQKYHEDTYYAYSLDIGVQQPKIIKWGRVYMQQFEGLHDEYSGFTIKVNKRDGVTMAETYKPFWSILNVAFKMLEMFINDIKPDGLFVNYESAVKAAEYLKSATDLPTDAKNALLNYLEMIQESPNAITTTPEADDGSILGGSPADALRKRENGLNRTATEVLKIMDWVEGKINQYTGTTGIEVSEPRGGFKLSLENKQRTRAATAFIDFILLNHLEDISITVLNYTQDIAKFKDIPAYKYMEAAVGHKVMDFIASMEKTPHRYGTFLDTFNTDLTRLEIKQDAKQALINKDITYHQYLLICKHKTEAKAASELSYQMAKAQKQRQLEQLAQLKGTDALAEAAFERQMKLEDKRGEWRQRSEQARAQGFITASQINGQTQLAAKQMQEEGQNRRLSETASNEINKIAETANAQAQQPVI